MSVFFFVCFFLFSTLYLVLFYVNQTHIYLKRSHKNSLYSNTNSESSSAEKKPVIYDTCLYRSVNTTKNGYKQLTTNRERVNEKKYNTTNTNT